MIKTYPDQSAYAAAGLPERETRVANITEGNLTKVDGVNVEKNVARWGDAIFTDSTGKNRIIDRDTLKMSLIPSNWTYVGPYLFQWDNDTMAVWKGNYASLPSLKFLDVCQYAITAITGTSLSINLRMSPDYNVNTTVTVTLTSAAISAATAQEISQAVAAKATEVGDTKAWWAYLADANGNKVDDDGTQIIIQCDTCVDYRFYNCSMTGGTIALYSWRDMPATDNYWKANASHWATNGRTLTAAVAVHSEAGNTDPMKKSEYLTSEYAAAIRAYYPTYEDYLRGEFGVMWPQKKGVFALPNGKELTEKYGPMMAPTKAGGMKAMYPALNWAYLQGGHLWDVNEGTLMMEDERLAILNATQQKAGKVTLGSGTYRWFAERYSVNNAWFFHGTSRSLNNIGGVNGAYQVGAVTLLKK
jgi:hypothetical protein